MERIDALGLRETADRPQAAGARHLPRHAIAVRARARRTTPTASASSRARCAQLAARARACRCRTWAGAGSTVRRRDIGLSERRLCLFRPQLCLRRRPGTLATADYGRAIPAAVRQGNLLGAQFHPERSGEAGARFLEGLPRHDHLSRHGPDGRPLRAAGAGPVRRAPPSIPPIRPRRWPRFAAAGADWAHVVDLDGARAGAPRQHDLIAELAARRAAAAPGRGRLPHREQLARMFDAGVGRVVIGSLAVQAARRWSPACIDDSAASGSRSRSTSASSDGDARWSRPPAGPKTRGKSLWDVAALYPEARHLLVTDIGRDGMLTGPNFDLARRDASSACRACAVQASGGVSSLADLRRLRDGAPARSSARPCGKGASTWRRRSALPARRIIPCLDVKDGRVVKGVQFRDHRDAGDIVEQAMRYRDEGADELVFYDITASAEGRSLDTDWVRRIAAGDRHPLRGRRRHPQPRRGRRLPRCRRRQGLDQLAGARAAGADRASSRAISAASASCSASTASPSGGDYWVKQYTGSVDSDPRHRPAHARLGPRGDRRAAPARSCSTACASDGVRTGYDIAHTRAVDRRGDGAGHRLGRRRRARAFPRRLRHAGASGALAATVFHDRLIAIPDLKEYLADAGSKCAADRGRCSTRSPGRRWTACSRRSSRTAATAAGADARLYGRGGACGDAGERLRDLLQPLEGAALAEGRDQRQSPRGAARSSPIATRMRCWSSPSRRARPAISARRAASARRPRRASAGSAARPHRRRPRRRRSGGQLHRPPARRRAEPDRAEGRRGRRRACARRRRPRRGEACIEEAADLLYHLTVLMEARGFGWDDVAAKLQERHHECASRESGSPERSDRSGPRTPRFGERHSGRSSATAWSNSSASPRRDRPLEIRAAAPVADHPAGAADHRDQRIVIVRLQPGFDHQVDASRRQGGHSHSRRGRSG